MSRVTLERSITDRSSCKTCKQSIEKDEWRLRTSFKAVHHAICAAICKPKILQRVLAANKSLSKSLRESLRTIAAVTTRGKLVRIVWRHAAEPRCLLELAKEQYALVTQVRRKLLSIAGSLDDVIAGVPDDDLEEVVDAAMAAGKSIGKAPAPAKNPVKQPRAKVRAKFVWKKRGDTSWRVIELDEANCRVTQTYKSRKPHKRTFDSVELARKYLRYVVGEFVPGWKFVEGDRIEVDPDEDFKAVKDKTIEYRYLENAKTKMFWDIDLDAFSLDFWEGKIGTKGTRSEEWYDSQREAKTRWKELLDEKLAAGYAEPSGFAARRRTLSVR